MNHLDLKLFAVIYQWSRWYKKDGRNYTPSNKGLAKELNVDYESIITSLDKLKELKLITINIDDCGFRILNTNI
ncbi:TPA: hypothetical protein QH056_001839 [Klebsiella oxytoca]|nr:hypothetical protein [Klebsiella oxytoca]